MKRLFTIFLIFNAIFSYSQEYQFHIDWKNYDSVMYFEGANYKDFDSGIPWFSALIPWDKPNSNPEFSIAVKSSTALNSSEIQKIQLPHLKNDAKASAQVLYEKKSSWLHIEVEPFYLDENSGEVKKINSFTVTISETSSFARKKALLSGNFATQSILKEGDWFKIAVKKSGIHKLSYEDIQKIGIDNPALVKLYGSGAILLPEDFSNGHYDDLQEIPIYMNKGADGIFGPGDYILFYARGTVSWTYDYEKDFFSHHTHTYDLFGYYFLTDDMGNHNSPKTAILSSETPDHNVSSFDYLTNHEEEYYNLLSSGREWYGDKFQTTLNYTYPFTIQNQLTNDSIKIRIAAAGRSNESSSMLVKLNNSQFNPLSFGTVNLSSHTGTYAIEKTTDFIIKANQEVLTVNLQYLQPNSDSEAYLNYITINGRASLKLQNNQLIFRDKKSAGFGNISEFSVSNTNANTVIWDISNPETPIRIPHTQNGSSSTFRIKTDDIREFVAFNTNGEFEKPIIEDDFLKLGKIDNQNLHGASSPEMIIVYSESLKEQALRLAEHRKTHDQIDVLSVSQEMIFNEFSSGTKNVAALRNFLKMFYDNNSPEETPKYLLLFGDGSYANRDTSLSNPNLILTYQSKNSLVPTSSYVSDDFYGLLDSGERLYDGLLDIGIGRLPVSNAKEAEDVVNKLIEYDQTETIGEWRNYLCFIGDDEDGNIHMKQANSLAEDIEKEYPHYNINKIFLDAYKQEVTSVGDQYPAVTRAINDQMYLGALIVNYTGHGSPSGMAHEGIISSADIKSWTNKGKYPLFLTATCEFSRYDEYTYDPLTGKKLEKTSAGEEVLLNPNGGSIGLFTTTRLVYSGPNHTLNEKFYDIVFEKKEDGSCYRMGDIIAYSKNRTGAGINKRNFTLLGDPSMVLSFPANLIITDSVNHYAMENLNDTISALDFVTISGHIAGTDSSVIENFNGTVIPVVYDKETRLKTLANDGGSTMEFDVRNNILYKGNVSVKNGYFSFSFYTPKDIGYNIGNGKISYYAYDSIFDAHGSNESLIIGGLGNFSQIDTIGPKIDLYMNDSLFRDSGIVDHSPELLVFIRDNYGINTTGNGIGHDITAILDYDRNNPISLNQFYQAGLDSYNNGEARYQYSNLSEGAHTISVKVWDIFNNSATDSIRFVVVESGKMLIEKIYNYPNPFIDRTLFNIEHNRPNQELEILIGIYDIQGNLVTLLKEKQLTNGYRLDPIEWNVSSFSGATIKGGIYVYRVIIVSKDGEEAVGSGRLIISN